MHIPEWLRSFVLFQVLKRGRLASFTTQKMDKQTCKLTIFIAGNRLGLTLSLLLLAGCAQFNSVWDWDSDRYVDPYAQSGFDDLLAFGANMANIPTSSRAEMCNTLLKHQKNYPGTGIQLHLMVGRLLSDACGEIPGILEGIGSIPPGDLSDERMQKLVDIDMEALKQLHEVSIKLASLERENKIQESKTASGSRKKARGLRKKAIGSEKKASGSEKKVSGSEKKVSESEKNENSLLREKLEAIRTMEKLLDESESVDGN